MTAGRRGPESRAAPRHRLGRVVRAVGLPGPRADRCRLEPRRRRAGPDRHRRALPRRNVRTVLLYGAVPVAGTQFAFFSAVAAMDVGPALLIEYTAPAAVVAWLWLRHGQRPTPLTCAGAGIAAAGLVLVLNLLSGADLAPDGVLWALAAMLGAATYFVLSARV